MRPSAKFGPLHAFLGRCSSAQGILNVHQCELNLQVIRWRVSNNKLLCLRRNYFTNIQQLTRGQYNVDSQLMAEYVLWLTNSVSRVTCSWI